MVFIWLIQGRISQTGQRIAMSSDESYDIPEGYYYTKDHEWVKRKNKDSNAIVVGITDYAAKMLNDIVYVVLPDEGSTFKSKDVFGQVESVKTVSDIYMPLTGRVVKTNKELTKIPEAISRSPYSDGWMLEVETTDLDNELKELLSASEYRSFIEEIKDSESD